MSPQDYLTDSYSYELPKELIAKYPMSPRENAKLLVFERQTQTITHTTIQYLSDFIPNKTSLIFNNTKVFKARLFGQKETQGKIELLIIRPLEEHTILCYIRGKVSQGQKLFFPMGLKAEVINCHTDGSRVVIFSDENQCIIDFSTLCGYCDIIGHIPLPPYMERDDTSADITDYQPIFAQHVGSVAAPTASLHFTPTLLSTLENRFSTSYITLHVGAGTFKSVDSDDIRHHTMHNEYFSIPPSTQDIIDSSSPLLCVGTTTTRVVEYYTRTHQTQGECNLFLHPHNPPQRVNHLLTNFHLPRSTLLMLVSSFIGRDKALELYQIAIQHHYRFYSYGDAMLII